ALRPDGQHLADGGTTLADVSVRRTGETVHAAADGVLDSGALHVGAASYGVADDRNRTVQQVVRQPQAPGAGPTVGVVAREHGVPDAPAAVLPARNRQPGGGVVSVVG